MPHCIIPYSKGRSLLKYVCAGVLAALPVLGFAKGERSSRWVTAPVVIDGNNNEWPQPYPFKEETDTKIQYAIANDAQTLYLTLKTSDEATKMKLRKNGLAVVIDTTTGRKLEATSFYFSVQEDIKPPDTGSTPVMQAAKPDSPQIHVTSIKITGTPAYDGSYKMADNKTGIAVAAAINDFNEVVWEIAIPFKCIYPAAGSHVADKERVDICFVMFGLSDDNIAQFERENEKGDQNAMPVWEGYDSSAHGSQSGGNPVRGANGGMAVGVGGGKGKGKGSSAGGAPVIDATAAMLDRQRAGQDNTVWKQIRLGYEP